MNVTIMSVLKMELLFTDCIVEGKDPMEQGLRDKIEEIRFKTQL